MCNLNCYGGREVNRQNPTMGGRNASHEAFCHCEPAHIVICGFHDLVLGLGKSQYRWNGECVHTKHIRFLFHIHTVDLALEKNEIKIGD
jgi:hypothetical protein